MSDTQNLVVAWDGKSYPADDNNLPCVFENTPNKGNWTHPEMGVLFAVSGFQANFIWRLVGQVNEANILDEDGKVIVLKTFEDARDACGHNYKTPDFRLIDNLRNMLTMAKTNVKVTEAQLRLIGAFGSHLLEKADEIQAKLDAGTAGPRDQMEALRLVNKYQQVLRVNENTSQADMQKVIRDRWSYGFNSDNRNSANEAPAPATMGDVPVGEDEEPF